MNGLTLGSLFAGIGGFELGAQWAGIETVWNCEIEPYCRKILKKHFPETKQYEDITKLSNPEPVSIISGGFPCQDFSIAGCGKGITGERSRLWFEMYRIIDKIRPLYVVLENSPELLKKGFEAVLYPLSEIGYDAEWQCISNAEFGFPHKRERVYVIAYSNKIRCKPCLYEKKSVFSKYFQKPHQMKLIYQLQLNGLTAKQSLEVILKMMGFASSWMEYIEIKNNSEVLETP